VPAVSCDLRVRVEVVSAVPGLQDVFEAGVDDEPSPGVGP